MRTSYIRTALIVCQIAAGSLEAAAERCNPHVEDCARRYDIADVGHLPVLQTVPIDRIDKTITRAIIVVHGNGRNPYSSFRSVFDAAQAESRNDETMILAPHFKGNDYGGVTSCDDDDCDSVAAGELYWATPGWKQGDHSVNPESSYSSFAVVDDLIQHLSDPARLPNLKTIVLAGHSAGGQFVQRFAVGTTIDTQLRAGLKLEFVVANPSTYLYLSAERPHWAGEYVEGGKYPGFGLGAAAVDAPSFSNPYLRHQYPFVELAEFTTIRSSLNSQGGADCQCRGAAPCAYERFKYGFDLEPLNPDHYMCSDNSYQTCSHPIATNQMIEKFLARKVTYILGQLDNSFNPEASWTNSQLDTRCGANFQGPDRLARGAYYFEHLAQFGQHRHRIIYAADVGHSSRGIFHDSYKGKRALFGGKLPTKEYLGSVYTIQQVATDRYLDAAYENSYDAMTNGHESGVTYHTDSSQRWIISRVDGDRYRIQQEQSLRYLDAYLNSSRDHRVMTRRYQDNDTQIWIIRPVAGESSVYTVQQERRQRYLDAYTSSSGDRGSMTRSAQHNDSQRWRIIAAP